MEELESSLNSVCILLSESLYPPVIGFIFTHKCIFFLLMHIGVKELAAVSFHVSKIIFKCQPFSLNAKKAGNML